MELVTTILLIGILAVTVLPRLLSDSSYSAFTLRNEFISELRQAQLRAMHNADRCYAVSVSTTHYQLKHFSGRVGNACTGQIRTEENQALQGGATIALTAGGSQSFELVFDQAGRVINQNCNGVCFTVSADDVVQIGVSTEGYIYAL